MNHESLTWNHRFEWNLEPDQHRWYQVPSRVVSASVKCGSTLISCCHQRPSLAALTSVSPLRKQSWTVGMLRWRQVDRQTRSIIIIIVHTASLLAGQTVKIQHESHWCHRTCARCTWTLFCCCCCCCCRNTQPNGAPTTLLTTAATQRHLRNSQVSTGHRMGAARSSFPNISTTALSHKKTCTSERKRSVFTHKPSGFKGVAPLPG